MAPVCVCACGLTASYPCHVFTARALAGKTLLKWKLSKAAGAQEIALSLKGAKIIQSVLMSDTRTAWYVVEVLEAERKSLPGLQICFRAAVDQFLFATVLTAMAELAHIGKPTVAKLLDTLLPTLQHSFVVVLPSGSDSSAAAVAARKRARDLVGVLEADHERVRAAVEADEAAAKAEEAAAKAEEAAAKAEEADTQVGPEPEPGASVSAAAASGATGDAAPGDSGATDGEGESSKLEKVMGAVEDLKTAGVALYDVVAPVAGQFVGESVTAGIDFVRGAGFDADTAFAVVDKLLGLGTSFPLVGSICLVLKGIYAVYKVREWRRVGSGLGLSPVAVDVFSAVSAPLL